MPIDLKLIRVAGNTYKYCQGGRIVIGVSRRAEGSRGRASFFSINNQPGMFFQEGARLNNIRDSRSLLLLAIVFSQSIISVDMLKELLTAMSHAISGAIRVLSANLLMEAPVIAV